MTKENRKKLAELFAEQGKKNHPYVSEFGKTIKAEAKAEAEAKKKAEAEAKKKAEEEAKAAEQND